MSSQEDGKYPNIKLVVQENRATLDKIAVEAATLDVLKQVLTVLNRHYEQVVYGDERRRKWLERRIDCSWGGSPLALFVEKVGPVCAKRVLTRELQARPELKGSVVKVSVGNQYWDTSVLVFKFTSAIYPAD